MKKKLSLLVAPIVMLAASTNSFADFGLTPYVGIDAQLRYMDFKKGFGNNLFRHNYPQGNAYVGLKFNDYIGVEVGYQASKKQTRTVPLTTGAINLGTALPANLSPAIFVSEGKIHGVHANLVGFLPICSDYNLELFGSIGLAHLRTSFQRSFVLIAGSPNPLLPIVDKFKKHKNVLQANIGLRHMMTDCVGFKAAFGWENTSKFKNIISNRFSNVNPSVSLRDSFIYSLGLFINF